MRPKVGHIEFLNCLPLYYGLVKSYALLDIELIKGNPTELNNLLINGLLDISPISSIEYARHQDSLVLFPDFTVSSDGEVKSILLLSCFPIEELTGKKIALTSTSATSQVLLKLILSRGYNVQPEYIIRPPDLCRMFTDADAALLIGDIALKYYVDGKDFYLYDLGIEWKKLTGKKMVYAVWAVNRRFAEIKSDLCGYVFDIFKKSMLYSTENLSEIAESAARWEPFDSSFLEAYFKSLRFDFSGDYQQGLLSFYKMAMEAGELRAVPELEFINLRSGIST
ncbi:MAG: menaquinone biosynthesis protein [Nitrospirae bacterium]|nr:menaquinone biosynthesis protein [Nitrospirota bacterium]